MAKRKARRGTTKTTASRPEAAPRRSLKRQSPSSGTATKRAATGSSAKRTKSAPPRAAAGRAASPKPGAGKPASTAKAAAGKKKAPTKATKQSAGSRKKATSSRSSTRTPAASTRKSAPATAARRPRRQQDDRPREDESVPTPPSSLDLDRRGTAARTGRAEMAEAQDDHATLTPDIVGGDVDADVESAYFSGDEAPGGDNPTPDQDIVDEIGKAIGVEYQDNEELRSSEKVADRDRHRWELDPASAEDYPDRDKE